MTCIGKHICCSVKKADSSYTNKIHLGLIGCSLLKFAASKLLFFALLKPSGRDRIQTISLAHPFNFWKALATHLIHANSRKDRKHQDSSCWCQLWKGSEAHVMRKNFSSYVMRNHPISCLFSDSYSPSKTRNVTKGTRPTFCTCGSWAGDET